VAESSRRSVVADANPSISDALVDLLGKPIAESTALCIPTALWGYPRPAPVAARDFMDGRAWGGTTSLPWKSLGVLELAALPTIGPSSWLPWVRQADVLLVAGGEATYLCAPDDRTLGVVDFSIVPHPDVFPENSVADAERWATDIGGPAYALDDQSAITVNGEGVVDVVSEGQWTLLPS
jgi:dipeptidase E